MLVLVLVLVLELAKWNSRCIDSRVLLKHCRASVELCGNEEKRREEAKLSTLGALSFVNLSERTRKAVKLASGLELEPDLASGFLIRFLRGARFRPHQLNTAKISTLNNGSVRT